MWPFQFGCWSTITPKNFAFVTLCISSLRKTSSWGFRFFFLDIINIWVFFTLKGQIVRIKPFCYFSQFRVKDWNCTNNWIMLNIYCGVISKENEWQDITGINNIVNVDQKQKGQRIEPWGTPMFRFSEGEWVWFQETKCSRSDR